MPVVELAMCHAHIAPSVCAAVHEIGVFGRANGAVVIGSVVVALSATQHRHAAKGEVVFLRGVPGDTSPCEEVVAHIVVGLPVLLILIGFQVFLSAVGTAPVVVAVSETDVEIGIDGTTVVVDVETGVGSTPCIGTGLHRAVIARLAFFLEHDVDDAGTALGREFGRGVVDDLDAVDALGGQLSVDPHLNAGVAAQRYIAVVVHLHRGDVLQHIAGRPSGIGDILRHIERFAVHLQPHGRPLSCHRHLF